MLLKLRTLTAFASLLLVVGAHDVRAQPRSVDSVPEFSTDIAFNSGQSVQPIFEGWTRNTDGSYQFHFGYLNRNYVEDIHLPIGTGNSIEPEGLDRGQPTYFYPRFNRLLFSVRVPADFGKRELVWTLTVHGKTERAIGWLKPEWEIDASAGAAGLPSGTASKNVAPSIRVVPPSSPALLAGPLKLIASVTDDGLPPVRKPRIGGTSENPPAFRFPEGGAPTAPVNVPQLQRRPRPRLPGLSVSWRVWRGPGAVTFDPEAVAVKDGQAATTATFKAPGVYVLRAVASDSEASTPYDVKVVVTDPSRRP
jgi:hypothetical protein